MLHGAPQRRDSRKNRRCLVYDIGAGHKFVQTDSDVGCARVQAPKNVKGIAASARTGSSNVSTTKRLAALILVTEKKVWERV